ncbi:hypothetical protein Sgly_2027 [Syntrophobotulus glycolicus DSM 8271]|uniref:Uncharacterized protein n=1 Tax=Syntrophobotulus glycolicus (strain DSM 8271 / FlGlyR) TaxID=645991 RepID=F0T1H9_SYNGF|nr:hypothetical protein [Syntrophobotulus glycolicus]ADY56320.1 hypothetical protein Sgly_2027 [Syntrophobotulus glycolicus DSM 8271]
MEKYDIVISIISIDETLRPRHIQKMLDHLNPDCEIIPFEIHENNVSAYGYANIEGMDGEGGLESLSDFLGPMLEDWIYDEPEEELILPDGKKLYVFCDYKTILI